MKAKRRLIGTGNKVFFRVAIFGSSRIKRNDPIYRQIKELAGMLGKKNIDVVTGGGPGLMEAANRGHILGREGTKAKSIGLGIKLPKAQKYNKSVDMKETFNRFSNRLDKFMLLSNAVVVAPGGIGTLVELFYTWQLVQVEHVCHIPIILLGKQWKGLIEWLEKEPLRKKYFDKKDLHLLFLADDSEEAMKVIDKAHEEFLKGNKDFCINYKKYKI